jgi:hypothetical protein
LLILLFLLVFKLFGQVTFTVTMQLRLIAVFTKYPRDVLPVKLIVSDRPPLTKRRQDGCDKPYINDQYTHRLAANIAIPAICVKLQVIPAPGTNKNTRIFSLSQAAEFQAAVSYSYKINLLVMKRFFLPLLMIAVSLGCSKRQIIDPVPDEPKVEKSEFLASFLSGRKIWRFEEFTIEAGGVSKTYNLSKTDSTGVVPAISWPNARHIGFAIWASGDIYNEPIDVGPFGKTEYPVRARINLWLPSSSPAPIGSWVWDDDRQTVALTMNHDTYFGAIISHISKTKTAPKVGYLDNSFPSKYRTLYEAANGDAADRVRIVFYEDDANGQIKYIYTMRAAWVVKLNYRRGREEDYEVIY